mgnify:CR=1 FL=1
MGMTIPDLIDLIKDKYKRFMDYPYAFIEIIGSKMNVYAWNKRWKNRSEGTGYGRKN